MTRNLAAVGVIIALISAAGVAARGAAAADQDTRGPAAHAAWLRDSLERIQTIQPGMTRADLVKVFTTEQGMSTPRQRTYVLSDCPYVKVDVSFKLATEPERDAKGGRVEVESPRDAIRSISKPYLAWTMEENLRRAQSIRVGMTRRDLLKVFTTEGGISAREWQTFVLREYPYLKVNVEFQAVPPAERDAQGRLISPDSPDDIIKKISKPYFAWSVMD